MKPPFIVDHTHDWKMQEKSIPHWDSVAKFIISGDAEAMKAAARDARKHMRDLKAELAEHEEALTTAEIRIAIANEIVPWMTSEMKLEKIETSAWHKFIEAIHEKRAYGVTPAEGQGHILRNFIGKGKEPPQIFLMQHDWAGVLADALDAEGNALDGAEVRLPYHTCCFEFRLSGRRLLMLCQEEGNGGILEQPIIETSIGWYVGVPVDVENGPMRNYISKCIAAFCVCMDAEVVTSEVIRAPHKLNVSREKQGKAKLPDFHIVSLSRRHRVERLSSTGNSEKGTKRLHFRRGHWRHYATHKTWIKWMLVGNPDLGFVEKQYRA